MRPSDCLGTIKKFQQQHKQKRLHKIDMKKTSTTCIQSTSNPNDYPLYIRVGLYGDDENDTGLPVYGPEGDDTWLAPFRASNFVTTLKCLQALIPSEILNQDALFVDIGCGEGGVLLHVASEFGCSCIGYELDHDLVRLGNARLRESKVAHRVKLVETNAENMPIDDLITQCRTKSVIIYCYLLPEGLTRLESKLKLLIEAGAILVVREWCTLHEKLNWTLLKEYALSYDDVVYMYGQMSI